MNGWVSLWFPLYEGLGHPNAPGLAGPPLQLLGQLGVLTPPLGAVCAAWLVGSGRRVFAGMADRTERLAWWTSAPVVALFCLAAVGGPPEAHWPAPAWIGVGLGVTHGSRRLVDSAWIASWIGLFASIGLALHGTTPLARLPVDPATRLTEGAVLADVVGRWALPEGVAAWEERVVEASPVLTERYQEAALIHWHLGIPAVKAPGCGRPDQYDLWAAPPLPPRALFVKPATSGTLLCTDDRYDKRGPHRLRGEDRVGRLVGIWDLWELDGG